MKTLDSNRYQIVVLPHSLAPPTISELVQAAEACDRFAEMHREQGREEEAEAFANYASDLRERLKRIHDQENKETDHATND